MFYTLVLSFYIDVILTRSINSGSADRRRCMDMGECNYIQDKIMAVVTYPCPCISWYSETCL